MERFSELFGCCAMATSVRWSRKGKDTGHRSSGVARVGSTPPGSGETQHFKVTPNDNPELTVRSAATGRHMTILLRTLGEGR
jgi:hypothetical protein